MTPWPAWTLLPALAFAPVEARAQSAPDSVRAAAPGIPDTTATRAMPLRPALPDLPSPSRAKWTSFWGTFVPVAAGSGLAYASPGIGIGLIGAGVLAGPVSGYVYGDCPGRGLQGFAGRTLATFVGGSVVISAIYSNESTDQLGAAVPMVTIAAAVLASTVYDIAVVGRYVRRRNDERLGLRPAPVPPPTPPPIALSEPPTEFGALRRSLVGTLVPLAGGGVLLTRDHYTGSLVIASGLVFGPLPGYTYGDCTRRGWAGAALRTGVFVTGLATTFLVVTAGEGIEFNNLEPAAQGVLIASASTMAVLAAYDIAVLPGHVRKRNDARAGGIELRMSLAPAVAPGTHAPALALIARF